jgi:hypothetical protein
MVRINNKKYSRKIRNNTIRRNKTNRKAKSKANRKTNRKAKSKANRKTNRKTNRKAKGKANRKVMVGGMMAAAPPPAALPEPGSQLDTGSPITVKDRGSMTGVLLSSSGDNGKIKKWTGGAYRSKEILVNVSRGLLTIASDKDGSGYKTIDLKKYNTPIIDPKGSVMNWGFRFILTPLEETTTTKTIQFTANTDDQRTEWMVAITKLTYFSLGETLMAQTEEMIQTIATSGSNRRFQKIMVELVDTHCTYENEQVIHKYLQGLNSLDETSGAAMIRYFRGKNVDETRMTISGAPSDYGLGFKDSECIIKTAGEEEIRLYDGTTVVAIGGYPLKSCKWDNPVTGRTGTANYTYVRYNGQYGYLATSNLLPL